MFNTMKSAMATALTLAVMGGSGAAMAGTGINFDPDGSGAGAAAFSDTWTWKVSSMLIDGGVTSGTGNVGDVSGTLLVQGQGFAARDAVADTVVFDNAVMKNFSFILSVPVLVARQVGTGVGATVNSVGAQLTWAIDRSAVDGGFGSNNFFRLYKSDGAVDGSAGTGFDAGSLILDGKVLVNANRDNKLTLGTFANNNSATPQNLSSKSGEAVATTRALSGNLNLLVDVCSDAEVADVAHGGDQQENEACVKSGAASFVDSAYFPLVDFTENFFTLNAGIGGQAGTPFAAAVPDKVVNTTPNFNAVLPSGTNDAGALNDFTCNGGGADSRCDVIASLDGGSLGQLTTDWRTSVVPEPTSLSLIGLGLLGAGSLVRRRRG